jgi:hypothetical protein
MTRGRVCRLQLLLVLASTDIFGSESRRTRDHILLSQIRDFPFRRRLVQVQVQVKVTLRLTVSQSVSQYVLVSSPIWGP